MIDDMNELKNRIDYHHYLGKGGNLEYEQWLERYWPIYISSPSWEEPGPKFPTRERAQAWLDGKFHRPGDNGYIVDTKA